MSSSPARRRRLAAIRTLPQAICEHCRVRLDRVEFPLQHVQRCEERARQEVEAADAFQHPAPPRPTIADRIRTNLLMRVMARSGIYTRGAER